MSVTVLRAGFHCAVQDLGREGHRARGVAVGGALDAHALRVANLLVGNAESAAGLELTLGTTRLRFAEEQLVAWCGGDFDVEVAGAKLPAGRCAILRADDELSAAAPANGGRAWLAMSGGVDVPLVLGSRGTDVRSKFGGVNGRALKDGDVLALGTASPVPERLAAGFGENGIASWGAAKEWCSTKPRHPYLRVSRGADSSRFDETVVDALLHGSFTVMEDADRMGIRLDGPQIDPRDNDELPSEPVAPGTIQIPPDGKPIVLLGDCQTIGGYPKIAHVITVDLPAAAQLRPGDLVRFAEVSVAEAQRLWISREHDLAWFRTGLSLRMS